MTRVGSRSIAVAIACGLAVGAVYTLSPLTVPLVALVQP